MEPKYMDTILDIVSDKTENKYSLAKEHLLNVFKKSENKRTKHSFIGIEIGYMKSSDLLLKMKSLTTSNIYDMIFKNFMNGIIATTYKIISG